MERTDFISTRDEVIENIKTLYSYIDGKEGNDVQTWAIEKMKRGRNFVTEVIDGKLCFAPSRFVGYANNTSSKHDENHGDGTSTDAIIQGFYTKVTDARLDQCLQKQLSQFGISIDSKKYWIPKNISVDSLTSGSSAKTPKYWVARVTSDDIYWEKAVSEHIWLTQQRYGQQTSSVI